MSGDDDINEVRRIRHEISEEHDHDVDKLVSHYQQLEKHLRESGKFRFADDRQAVASKENGA